MEKWKCLESMRKFNVEFGLGLNFLIPFAREVVVFEADITASIHLEPTLIFLFHASMKKIYQPLRELSNYKHSETFTLLF